VGRQGKTAIDGGAMFMHKNEEVSSCLTAAVRGSHVVLSAGELTLSSSAYMVVNMKLMLSLCIAAV
jgi:hypothetical protein